MEVIKNILEGPGGVHGGWLQAVITAAGEAVAAVAMSTGAGRAVVLGDNSTPTAREDFCLSLQEFSSIVDLVAGCPASHCKKVS